MLDREEFNRKYHDAPEASFRVQLAPNGMLTYWNSKGGTWSISLSKVFKVLIEMLEQHGAMVNAIRSHPEFDAQQPWKYREKVYRKVFMEGFTQETPALTEAKSNVRSQTKGFVLMLDKVVCSLLNLDHDENQLHFDRESLAAAVRSIQSQPSAPDVEYDLTTCSTELLTSEDDLALWIDLLKRKRQGVFFGPPGTGKTYTATKLADLIAGSDGIVDLVQFHPAYEYEDFVAGIKPTVKDGGLVYEVQDGRLLDFCEKARECDGDCVLIIDEINRANLSRVFGELMYLLEYREADIALAGGGRFSFPANVLIIGTMNTADRSIALVDYALRRRFAFIELKPNMSVIAEFHQGRYDVAPLIGVLEQINQAIAEKAFHLGHTFFLCEDLEDRLLLIWKTEIEPYLDEYFFDRPDIAQSFHWEAVSGQFQSEAP